MNVEAFLFCCNRRKLILTPQKKASDLLGINKQPLERIPSPVRDTASGTIWATGLAVFFCLLFGESEYKAGVPIAFLVVLLMIARRYGSTAANFATLISAVIFAELLFAPLRSAVVDDIGERANLGWMVLGGLVISNFFARPKTSRNSGRDNDKQ